MKTRHLLSAVALGALLSVALGVLAQSGGYPTRARFNSVGIGAAPPAGNGGLAVTTINGIAPSDFARLSQSQVFSAAGGQVFRNTSSGEHVRLGGTGAADSAPFMTFYNAANMRLGYIQATASNLYLDAEATASDTIKLDAATVMGGASAAVDMTPATGTFQPSFDNACTVTPAPTFQYSRMGMVVVMTTGQVSCTSDSIGFVAAAGAIPAALRPATGKTLGAVLAGENNGTDEFLCAAILATGELRIGRIDDGTCNVSSWTASGNKVLQGGYSFAYGLD